MIVFVLPFASSATLSFFAGFSRVLATFLPSMAYKHGDILGPSVLLFMGGLVLMIMYFMCLGGVCNEMHGVYDSPAWTAGYVSDTTPNGKRHFVYTKTSRTKRSLILVDVC